MQINIHSINCKIEAFSGKEKLNNTNSELFYFNVSTDNINLSIMPLIDIVEGEPKENYNIKIEISNAIFSHNNTISRTTKYKPIDLFNINEIIWLNLNSK